MPARSQLSESWGRTIAIAVLVGVTFAVYAQTFHGPFIFDDLPTIVENPALRQHGSLRSMLFPDQPAGLTSSGRPLVSLSLALNYIWGGENVVGYHGFNLLVHLAAGLTLFGFTRRTLKLPALRDRFGACATWLALAIALAWMVHPLQTESVTYIVQRAEALMGLFYLLTLYLFTRSVEARNSRPWLVLSVASCLLGMTSKEVMVSAPLIVLCYDRTFIAGSFREAWRRRRAYYLALGATWLVLAMLVLSTGGDRGGTMGNVGPVSAPHYWLNQFEAIVRYLGLSFWPYPQVFEYGPIAIIWPIIVLSAVLVFGLLVLTGLALRRWPSIGFAALWFFCILAPTLVIPGTVQTIVEHRMYLALAPVLALGFLLLHRWLRSMAWGVFAVAIAAFGFLTWQRNQDYQSNLTLWADTVAKRPENPVAQTNVGLALFQAGRFPEAISHYETALKISPRHIEALYNLAIAYGRVGRFSDALAAYERTTRLNPRFAEAENNWGHALVEMGRGDEAREHYEKALALKPTFADPANNLGLLALSEQRPDEARMRFMQALRLDPAFAEAHYNLGNLEAQSGAMPSAVNAYEEALRLRPDYAEARLNLGNALLALQQMPEAIFQYQAALRLKPDLADARLNLSLALLQSGNFPDAIPLLEHIVKTGNPAPLVYHGLGFALAKVGRMAEAVSNYETYVRLVPDDADAREELAALRR